MTESTTLTRTPAELQEHINALTDRTVLLMLTDNRHRMVSTRHSGDVVTLRAHKMFQSAPDNVLKALARLADGNSRSMPLIQEYINNNQHAIRDEPPRPQRTILRPEGKYFDLQEIHDHLNATYLSNRSTASVTWGRQVKRKVPRNFRMGWYDPMRNLISLNQRLDKSDIPRYMVEYVVFHEMLHGVLGIGTRRDGRRDIHGSTFKLMEQTYPDYEKALAFEKKKWG